MKITEKFVESKIFQIFSVILIFTSMLMSALPSAVVFADEPSNANYKEEHGEINNGDAREEDEANFNKQVSFGDKPGEYFIDLKVEGKDSRPKDEKTDIVLVYDNSNSMNAQMDNGKTRAVTAKEATTEFVESLLSTDANKERFRVALVTYGSSIFDGQMNQTWASNPGLTANHSFKQFTNDPANIASQLPSYVPSDSQHSGDTWHGGTFTQQALVEAGNILGTSNAKNKVIVTITDGAPTLSYINGTANTNGNIRGNGTSFTYTGGNHGTPTINTAGGLKQNYELYTIGLGLEQGDSGANASPEAVKNVINGISTSPDHAYIEDSVQGIVDALEEISNALQADTVVNGSILDPITDEFILQGGWHELTASSENLKEGVTVDVEDQHVIVNGLNLGEGDWINVRYKVQIDTDNHEIDPNKLHKTNGTTTLTPNGDDPDKKYEFPEPEASTVPVEVQGKKIWIDFGYEEYRPDSIDVELIREIKGKEVVIKRITVETNGTDVWEYQFDDVFLYDANGDKIEYKLREIMPEDSQYDPEYGSTTDETVDIRNILKQNADIQLVKTGKSTSELGEDVIEPGKDILYTFEMTNTGNLPLKNITLTDELEGMSDFTFETINGEAFTGDIAELVLQPGDVLVATATYEATQNDLNHGHVENYAEVEGTPTTPDPSKENDKGVEFDKTPVKDDDDALVPGDLEAGISLEKTADKEKVTQAGDEVIYTFVVTNTGNTTLTDVTLTDDMLGGDIALEKTVLNPGESTTATATYDVTQDDINVEEIINVAEVEGTPPPAYTENPENPDKVTDEDDEIVEATQESSIGLVKESDKEELVVGEMIKYTFTATNTGNTTLTNVQITDVLEGISDISYVSINGEAVANPDDITLQPGDVLVANATYEVTQDDVDLGQVFNEATVTGIDPKDEKVTDKDDESVPSNPELGIELVKTSDKQYVTEAGQEIEYTFDITNTSNVTLVDVTVEDKMLEDLNIDIELEKTTLKPGEKTTATATYVVTDEDLKAGHIENIATATGTPPNPNDEPPVSPPAENEVPVAKINLEKSSTPEVFTKVGQEIVYTLVVTNTGEITLNEVTLTDDMLGGNITLDVDHLAPGESTEVQVPYFVTEEDLNAGEILNTADTEGTPEGYDPEDPNTPGKVTDTDEDEVLGAAIIIDKKADKEEVEEAGEVITYTFTVTNTGKTVLENVEVQDDMLAALGITVELEKTTLEPGESTTGSAEYTVTQADIDKGGVYNVATSTGTPPGYDPEDPYEPPVSPPDEENVPSTQNANIKLDKSADIDEYTQVGDEVVYTFTVTNTGNVTLTDVKVEDETFQFEVSLGETTLLPGDSTTGTYTHVVTQADLDNREIHNFANTEGTPPPLIDPEDPDNPVAQDPVTDEDDEIVKGKQDANLVLEKVADQQEVQQAGDEITYTLTVTNKGNITLSNVTVNDEMLGGDLEVTPSTLAPGESGIVTGTYTVTQEDVDSKDEIINIATATGTPPGGDPEDPDNPKTPPVEEEVPVVNDPEITLVKLADKEKLVKGETITYTFTATNTGNTTLNNVNLVDELEGISEIEYVSVNDEKIADSESITLLPGDVLVASATYEVTQEDVNANEVYNHATVEGTPPAKENPEDPDNPIEQDPVTDDDNAKVPSEHKPALELEKTAEKEIVSEAGDIITYKFVVTNTGNVTIDNPRVDDPMLAVLETEIELDKSTLAPGESTIGYADYVVTQEDIDNVDNIINIATATGTPPGEDPEDPTTPPVEEEVPVEKNPSIDLVKQADKETYAKIGEQVTYTFTVTNTGNTTLTDVTVYDETFDVDVEIAETTLAPGDSTTGTFTHTITRTDLDNGEIHNIAEAEGTPPPTIDPEDPENPTEHDPVTDEDDEIVEAEQTPALELEKKADKQEVSQAGDKIKYTLTVKNTGNVTLNNVTVNDEMLGGDLEVTPSTLAAGESGTVTGTYTVTQEDIDSKDEIVNIATATGTPPGEDPEDPTTPPVEEEVPVVNTPEITLVKLADKEKLIKGETITYTFTATNTGNTTLNKVNLVDELEGISEIEYVTVNDKEIADPENITLLPGDVLVASATYEVTQKDVNANEVYNHATVEGTPPAKENPEDPDNPIEQDPVTDEDDVKVPSEHKPAIGLEKKADKQEVSQVGDKIKYTLTVTNEGNVTLDNVTVNDEMLGGDLEVTPSTLAPGESGTVTGTYTVTQEDIDNKEEIVNIATATGTPPGEDPEDPDNPTTPPVEENVPVVNDPEITLVKLADKEKLVKGETITYTFTATNTGNTTLNKVNLVDELEGISEIEYVTVNDKEIVDPENITLLPGDVLVASATYEVTQEDVDANQVYNHATVEGTPPAKENPEDPDNPIEQDSVTDDDDVKVPSKHKPALELEKTTKKEFVSKAGDIITYKFVVTNTGNVTIDKPKVDDPMLAELDIKIKLDKNTLAPGESTIGYADYEVTQKDIDSKEEIVNIATATGTPPGEDPEDPTTPPVEEEVPVKKDSQIHIDKTADKESYAKVGEKVTYTFTVTNTGNTTLTDVTVYDETFDVDVEVDETTLAPGESTTGTFEYKVTQEDLDREGIHNVAIAEGTPPNYDPEDPNSKKPTDEDEEFVKSDQNPHISLEKTSDVEKITEVGQEVTYTFVVTNTGNTTLDDVVVDDPMLDEAGVEVKLDTTTLKPGESATGQAVYTVTQEDITKNELINIATATGTPPGYDPEDPNSPQKPTDEDADNVPVQKPSTPVKPDPEKPVKPTPEQPEKPEKPGSKLPKTATNTFTIGLVGIVLLLIGLVAFVTRRQRLN